jgi:4-hydroxyacetophenone monooxygenase
MAKIDPSARHELLAAGDDVIADAVKYADPMVLRGLLYQLTGDPEVASIKVKTVLMGFYEGAMPATDADDALLRRKAIQFLKDYRDKGAGPISVGPAERLQESLSLIVGEPIPDDAVELYVEYMAIDPWKRSLNWQAEPDAKRLKDFTVTIIGAGMGGLIAGVMLKRAGIKYAIIEKNAGVGGTWYENRYPGARVDTPSRSYTHMVGVDFNYPNPFCAWQENQKYFNWVADSFDVRKEITFNTEVSALTWDEKAGMWDIRMKGPDGERVHRSNAVITAVGFLNRPNLPTFEGQAEFQGPSWHTARWPEGMDVRGKRVAVVGTGCTGYQMIPELALEAGHVTVFQRTPQWLFPAPGYRSPFPPQVNWLDRNLPFHTNFMRFRTSYGAWYEKMTEVETDFGDPYACNASNKQARDACIAFLKKKLKDPNLVAAMTPDHPVWSARPVIVDPEYSVLDAIQRDNVTLVTSGIKRINRTGIAAADGSQHDVDAIVFATGFHATEYLFPMTVTGRNGVTTNALWAKDGARAFLGCMIPGFPNLWSLYGPNTNGALAASGFHEMVMLYAMQCMERLILENKRAITVTEDAYWRYNNRLDEGNRRKVWSDPRAHNYYWTQYGRSAVQNPLTAPQMWHLLRKPDFADLDIR